MIKYKVKNSLKFPRFSDVNIHETGKRAYNR